MLSTHGKISELKISPEVELENEGATAKRVAVVTIAWLLLLAGLSVGYEDSLLSFAFAGGATIADLLTLRWLRRWERRHGIRLVRPRSWLLWVRDLRSVPASAVPRY